jgi:hypothetical protein
LLQNIADPQIFLCSTLALISFSVLCAAQYHSSCRTLPSKKKSIALKLCKQHQAVEESEVSSRHRPNFHTLINNCVENLIVQKYFSWSSAQLLPLPSFQILTGLIASDTVACRSS